MKIELRTYSWNDESPSEETNGRQGAVGYKREGGEGVDDGVYVSQSLEPFEAAASVAVPERAMAAEEDFDGAESPPENLVETVGEVDGS